MGKISQQLGKYAEERALWFLIQIKAKCIEKISTPIINVGGKAIYNKQSSIDFTAALPTSGSIYPYIPARIEVKLCDSDKLHHSRLQTNQIKWLTDWNNCGFYSFVLWVHKKDVFFIQYPNKFFCKGKSLLLKQAEIIMKNSIYNI